VGGVGSSGSKDGLADAWGKREGAVERSTRESDVWPYKFVNCTFVLPTSKYIAVTFKSHEYKRCPTLKH
jgi:hypothetical protein